MKAVLTTAIAVLSLAGNFALAGPDRGDQHRPLGRDGADAEPAPARGNAGARGGGQDSVPNFGRGGNHDDRPRAPGPRVDSGPRPDIRPPRDSGAPRDSGPRDRPNNDRPNSDRPRDDWRRDDSRHDGRSNDRNWNRDGYRYDDRNRYDDRHRSDDRYRYDNRRDDRYRNDYRYGYYGYRDSRGRAWRYEPRWYSDYRYRYYRYDRGRYYARQRFSIGIYFLPRGYSYRVWRVGEYLPYAYFDNSRYELYDYWRYDLYEPPYWARWIRVGDDALLIDIDTCEVIDGVYGLFY